MKKWIEGLLGSVFILYGIYFISGGFGSYDVSIDYLMILVFLVPGVIFWLFALNILKDNEITNWASIAGIIAVVFSIWALLDNYFSPSFDMIDVIFMVPLAISVIMTFISSIVALVTSMKHNS